MTKVFRYHNRFCFLSDFVFTLWDFSLLQQIFSFFGIFGSGFSPTQQSSLSSDSCSQSLSISQQQQPTATASSNSQQQQSAATASSNSQQQQSASPDNITEQHHQAAPPGSIARQRAGPLFRDMFGIRGDGESL